MSYVTTSRSVPRPASVATEVDVATSRKAVADLIVALEQKQLESHRQEITALFCDLRGFTGFSESLDPEDVMAILAEYHAAIGEIIIKYSGTPERCAGDGVMSSSMILSRSIIRPRKPS